MLPELDDYDWGQAFQYAGEIPPSDWEDDDYMMLNGEPNIDVAITSLGFVKPFRFSRRDVAEVFAMSEGERDERPWIIYGKLKSGHYFYLEAGCDYTGWD